MYILGFYVVYGQGSLIAKGLNIGYLWCINIYKILHAQQFQKFCKALRIFSRYIYVKKHVYILCDVLFAPKIILKNQVFIYMVL
jgi:hypothetical protein